MSAHCSKSDIKPEKRHCMMFISRHRNAMLFVICVSCMANALFYLTYAARNQGIQNGGLFFMFQRNVVIQDIDTSNSPNKDSGTKIIQENLSVSRKLQGESDSKHSRDSDEKIVNPHNFQFSMNQPDICKGNKTIKLIVVVCTAMSKFEERQAIRETWGNYLNEPSINGKIVFLVGVGTDKKIQDKVKKENEIYNDIVQENFLDSYRNLSLKSVAALKWVRDYCNNANFLLKIDDDIFVNIPNLVKLLDKYSEQHKNKKYIVGHVFVGARPVQDKRSKWYTPKEWFAESVYPKYVSGTTYIVSKDAVSDLFEASLYIKPFWLEDIYITGLCARRAKISHIHNGAISYTERTPNGCSYKNAITGHQVKPLEMYKIYIQLSRPYLRC